MKIASFNVNSIKARLPRVLEWLEEFQPDVACLQELKCVDENFPAMEIESLGYNVAIHGQKTYNGVAILSKHPIKDVRRGLPGGPDFPNDDDQPDQARYIEAVIKGVRIGCIYLPNGNPIRDDGERSAKFDYKLRWMDRLTAHAKDLLKREEKLVLAGDYNVIPKDEDVYSPAAFADDALTQPESRARFRALMFLGFTDALRQIKPVCEEFTYYDYQGGAWAKGNGLRIDHLLLSPQAADCLKDCQVDRVPRGKEKASDHTPIWCELEINDE